MDLEMNENDELSIKAGDEAEKEYVIFTDTTGSGRVVEMAVVDEFEYERKYYVVGALVENDEINDENLFIYRLKLKGKEDYDVEKISDPKEYESVAKAYIEMESN